MRATLANDKEFFAVIDGLFEKTTIADINAYKKAERASKEARKEKINHLTERLNYLKAIIEQHKAKIKQTNLPKDKKLIGIRLNQLIATKMALLKAYKKEKNLTPFSELSHDAKVYACSKSFISKYILTAFAETTPQAFSRNNDGSFTVDIEMFQQSATYQDAIHIRDYISSYIDHYPERVKGSRYFIGLYKNERNLTNITSEIDAYFAKINKQDENKQKNLRDSHQGIELIEVYPIYNLQAVRLIAEEALGYEGRKMKHCVSGYWKDVKEGKKEIYSIREYVDDEKEYIPHVTIEYKEGKIAQIKGYNNKAVDSCYTEATREFLMHLLNLDDFSQLMNNEAILKSEKENIGILFDEKGNPHDIYNPQDVDDVKFAALSIKSNNLRDYPISHLRINKLIIEGQLGRNTLKYLSTCKEVDELVLRDIDWEDKVLDLSQVSVPHIRLNFQNSRSDVLNHSVTYKIKQIRLSSKTKKLEVYGFLNQLQIIDSSSNLTELKLQGHFDELADLPSTLKRLYLSGKFPSLTSLANSPNLEQISLNGKFENLTEIPPLPNLLTIDLTAGNFNKLSRLDFSTSPKLQNIELFGAELSETKEIIIPPNIRHFRVEHNSFPKLEVIDIAENTSQVISGENDVIITPELERMQKYMQTILPDKQYQEIEFNKTYTPNSFYLKNTVLPKIKKIKISQNIKYFEMQRIFFSDDKKDSKWLDLSDCQSLKEIEFEDLKFNPEDMLDISDCTSITKVRCNIEVYRQIRLPLSIEELGLPYIAGNYHNVSYNNLDFRQYTNLKTLSIPVMPTIAKLPSSLKKLNSSLFEDNENIQELDFSQLEFISISSSDRYRYSNLKRIALPKDFTRLGLFNICPNLKEIDARSIDGSIWIWEIGSKVHPSLSERSVVFVKEGLQSLKKIKIGCNTDLRLTENIEDLPITIEVPHDVEEEKIAKLKEAYPKIKVQRDRTIKDNHLLIEAKSQIRN